MVTTVKIIKKRYDRKDILLSSLRGSESHFHFHLVPLWEREEKGWRNKQKDWEQYKDGHLMEFLGFLERTANERDEIERRKEGWSVEEQRKKIIILLGPEVEKLRIIAGFLIEP